MFQLSVSSSPAVAATAQWLSHAVVVLLLVTALFAARDARGAIQGRLLAALALSLAALEVATGAALGALAEPVRVGLRLLGVANLALLWLFCLSILRDGFRIGRMEAAGSVLLIVGPLLVAFDQPGQAANPAFAAYSAAAPFVMIAHVSWVCFAERAGDLVDVRRRARFWIPLLLAIGGLTSVLSEEIGDPAMASLIRTGLAGLPIVVVILWWLVAIDPARLRFAAPSPRSAIDSRDAPLLARLLDLMQTTDIHREPGLTIDRLAQRLGTPTHRLRALINGGLGFRNFAAFTNRYRLAEARAALADPGRGRDTILAIAFEAGFASLQTFNRVFRQAEGITPTEYRAQALAVPRPEPETSARLTK